MAWAARNRLMPKIQNIGIRNNEPAPGTFVDDASWLEESSILNCESEFRTTTRVSRKGIAMHRHRSKNVLDTPRVDICDDARIGAMNPPKPMPAFIIPTAMPLLRENPEAIRMEFGKIETAQVPSPSTTQNR